MTLHPFESRLSASWLPPQWRDVTVLVAVSGGADSVALLRGLAALKLPGEGRLVAAHVNHQLRGAESDADQTFVAELCRQLGIPCEVASVGAEIAKAKKGQGIEAAARRARYDHLERLAERLAARFVVTGHTADDQAETILQRILRGTGIRGLTGISRSRRLGPVTLLRPMLDVRRFELIAYLTKLKQPFRNDSSNCDASFTRNRIRHDLLPRLSTQYYPGIVDALLRLGHQAGQSQEVIDRLVEELAERSLLHVGPDEVGLDLRVLAAQPKHLVCEVVRLTWKRQGWPLVAMGFDEWVSLAAMIVDPQQSTAKRMFPGIVLAEVRGEHIRISRGT